MRVVLVVAVLGLVAATPADACPRNATCIAAAAHVTEPETPRARVTTLRLAISAAESPDMSGEHVTLRYSLRTHVVAKRRDVAMPAIWQTLRREVYRRMPRYEERTLTMVMSPVVVEGTFDTVPGVGLAGDF